MQKLFINNKEWAVGFWWQMQENSARKHLHALNSDLSEGEYKNNIYVCQHIVQKQVGVSYVENPKDAANTHSLAALMANVYRDNKNVLFLYAFDDGTAWMFVLKDGMILPQGDQYGDYADVKREYDDLIQADVWNISKETSGTEESLEDINQHIKMQNKKIPKTHIFCSNFFSDEILTYISAHPFVILAGLATIIVVIGLIIGISNYFQSQKRQARLEKIEQKRKEIFKNKEEPPSLSEVRQKYFPPEWTQEPSPVAVVEQCYNRIKKKPYYIKGWKISATKCLPEKLQVTRKWTNNAAFTELPRNAEFGDSPKTIHIVHLFNLKDVQQKDDLLPKKVLEANFYELAKQIEANLKLSWTLPQPKNTKKRHNKYSDIPSEISSPYLYGEFNLDNVSPNFLNDPSILSEFPGLIIKSLKHEEEWKITGVVYAQKQDL
jgi:hypothetical protein